MPPTRTHTKETQGLAGPPSSSSYSPPLHHHSNGVDIAPARTHTSAAGLGAATRISLPGSSSSPYGRSPPVNRLSQSPQVGRLSSSPTGTNGSGSATHSLSSSPHDANKSLHPNHNHQLVRHDPRLANTTLRAHQELEALEQRALAVTGHVSAGRAPVILPAAAAGAGRLPTASSSLFIPRGPRFNAAGRSARPIDKLSTEELKDKVFKLQSLLASSASTNVSASVRGKLQDELSESQKALDSRLAMQALGAQMDRTTLDPQARDEKELEHNITSLSLSGRKSAKTTAEKMPMELSRHKPLTVKAISSEEADRIQQQVWEFEKQQIREATEALEQRLYAHAFHEGTDVDGDWIEIPG